MNGLNNLKELNLSDNQISEIPDEFYQINKLEKLDLSNNLIRTISVLIRNFQNLTNLNLSQNLISTLPFSVHQLPLKILNITQNLVFSCHSFPYYSLKDKGTVIQKKNRISIISPKDDILFFRMLFIGDSNSGQNFPRLFPFHLFFFQEC